MGAASTPRLSGHGLCGLRGTGPLDLRQPPAAAVLRGVPSASPIPTPPRGLIRAVTMIPASGEFTYATQAIRKTDGGATVPENLNALAGSTDMVEALDRLQAMAPAVEERQSGRRLVRRRSARGIVQGAARRRGVGQVDHAGQLVGEWRQPRQCFPRQPRRTRTAPSMAARHPTLPWLQAIQEMNARGLRVTFYPFIPDGRAARQHAAEPVFRQTSPRRGSPRFPGGGRITCSPAGRFRGDGGPRPPRPQARLRRCSVRRRLRASAWRVSRFRGPARPATGACAAWCCTTPISARPQAGSKPS